MVNKAFLVILFLTTILMSSFSFEDTLIVSASVCPILEEPSFESPVLIKLKKGDKVILGERYENNWLKVRYKNHVGYVRKFFVKSEHTTKDKLAKVTLADLRDLEIRTRASVYSTSAAAIRGLNNEDVRERENLRFADYDFESLKWIEENFDFKESEFEFFYER